MRMSLLRYALAAVFAVACGACTYSYLSHVVTEASTSRS